MVGGDVRIDLSNAGTVAVPLAVYAHHLPSLDVTPYDVGPGASVSPTVGLDALTRAYDVDVHGPNGVPAARHGPRFERGRGGAGAQ